MNLQRTLIVSTMIAALLTARAQGQVSGAEVTPSRGVVPKALAAPVPGSEASTSAALDEVVVTAQRRSENLQDVPVAVSVVSGAQLERLAITDVLDLRDTIPALNITNTNGALSTSLRGVGSTGVAPGFENPVAIYVDGVYYASQVSTFLGFNNIAQIDVLKGPQGTLFGRNATAGVIQVTTRTPGQEYASEGEISYGNYQTVSGKLYVSGPIASNLAADVAYQGTRQGEGWGRNLYDGSEVYRDNHDDAVRSKWVFTPADGTRFTLIGDYSNSKNSLIALSVLPGTYDGFGLVPRAGGLTPSLGYNIDSNTPDYKSGYSGGVSLRWDQSIGPINFADIVAYRQSRYSVQFDYDAGLAQPGDAVAYTWPDQQFSEEIQLSSQAGGIFSWVAGAY